MYKQISLNTLLSFYYTCILIYTQIPDILDILWLNSISSAVVLEMILLFKDNAVHSHIHAPLHTNFTPLGCVFPAEVPCKNEGVSILMPLPLRATCDVCFPAQKSHSSWILPSTVLYKLLYIIYLRMTVTLKLKSMYTPTPIVCFVF